MKRVKRVVFVTVMVLLAAAGLACAGQGATQKAESVFESTFPQVEYTSFEESQIAGLYEVVAGGNIMYFYPDKKYLVFGEIWTKDGQSLTAEKRTELMAARVKSMPLDKAIKIGSGKHTVVEFSDPDCPYCRKASAFLDAREDITRYVFLFPIDSLHPDARKKSQHILCSEDSASAYLEAMSGSFDDKVSELKPDCDGSAELLAMHMDTGRSVGVAGTPVFLVDGEIVHGADLDRIKQILSKEVGK